MNFWTVHLTNADNSGEPRILVSKPTWIANSSKHMNSRRVSSWKVFTGSALCERAVPWVPGESRLFQGSISTKSTFETDTLKLILIETHTWKLTLLHSSRSQQLAQLSWHRLCVWTTQQSSSKSGTQQGKRGKMSPSYTFRIFRARNAYRSLFQVSLPCSYVLPRRSSCHSCVRYHQRR